MQYTGQKPVDPLSLSITPLAAGQKSQWTGITAQQNGDVLTVTVVPVRGGYPGMESKRGYDLRLPADWPPNLVVANGVPLHFGLDEKKPGWHFDGNTLTTIIPVPASDVHRATTITIRRDPGSLAARAQLDGFAGRLHRIIIGMQTGERLRYHPEIARAEVAAFSADTQRHFA
jgi:alpha-glucosidase